MDLALDLDALQAVALQGLNAVTLAGAVFVKAPQLLQIWRVRSVSLSGRVSS